MVKGARELSLNSIIMIMTMAVLSCNNKGRRPDEGPREPILWEHQQPQIDEDRENWAI